MATIKAGTYQFNDMLTFDYPGYYSCYDLYADIIYNGNHYGDINITAQEYEPYGLCLDLVVAPYSDAITIYASGYSSGWQEGASKTITILNDAEASDEFHDWFTANTVEVVEEQPPVATIQYNGSTIASLEAGQTATLKCQGMKMETDVVVEVGETGGSSNTLKASVRTASISITNAKVTVVDDTTIKLEG